LKGKPITCSPYTDLKRAIRLMVENHIHRLVVQRKGQVRGILTPSDILPLIIEKKIDAPIATLVKGRSTPVYQETPLFIAWRILKISRSYALPVLDKNGHLTGIITDRDFFGAGRDSHSTKTFSVSVSGDEDIWTWESVKNIIKCYYEVSDMDLPKDPVKKHMMKRPTTVFIRTPAHKTAEKMYNNNFRYLPVIDHEENLIGMISDLDIISTLLREDI